MKRLAVLCMLGALSACGGGDPQSAANGVTRAVYDDNLASVAPYFDDATRAKVSRASVGVLSDKMHALGSYTGLTLLGADNAKHEYTYRASFSKGALNLVVRVDGDGRLAAYRVFPSS
ncbi:MAG: hypothetical protein WCA52_09500 [Candidatus Aquilonibacter sp.]|jgi:hypothetical protein